MNCPDDWLTQETMAANRCSTASNVSGKWSSTGIWPETDSSPLLHMPFLEWGDPSLWKAWRPWTALLLQFLRDWSHVTKPPPNPHTGMLSSRNGQRTSSSSSSSPSPPPPCPALPVYRKGGSSCPLMPSPVQRDSSLGKAEAASWDWEKVSSSCSSHLPWTKVTWGEAWGTFWHRPLLWVPGGVKQQ